MRAMVILCVLGASVATRAEEPPPPPPPPLVEDQGAAPPVDAPPIEVPPREAPPPPPVAPDPPEGPKAEPALPQADAVSTGFGGDACWGSGIGCGGGGCLPGAGTALGAGILATSISAGLAEGGCGGVVLIIAGAVGAIAIGVPSAVLLGPCACGSATAGGVVSAMMNERDVGPVLVGSVPGAAVAALGTAGVVWGVLALDGAADLTYPLTILGVAVALQALAGPVTVAGISIADGMAGPASPPPPQPSPSSPASPPAPAPVVAMRF